MIRIDGKPNTGILRIGTRRDDSIQKMTLVLGKPITLENRDTKVVQGEQAGTLATGIRCRRRLGSSLRPLEAS